MSKKLRELQTRKTAHVQKMRAITDKADAENRDLNDAEVAEFDAEKKALASTSAAIEREQTVIEAERNATAVVVADDADISGGAERKALDPKRGFKHKGEFFAKVRDAGTARQRGATIDDRLKIDAAAPTTFGNENAGADGGYLIPPDFAKEIFTLSLGEDSLLQYVDDVDIESNSMVFPKDETTPWGTDGVRAYWQAEAGAGTQTKPKLSAAALRLHKLLALVPVTDELASDATALASYLPPLMARSIKWKTNEAILFGTGAGQPLGMFTSTASVVQAKDSGQATKTLTIGNVTNMVSRLVPGSGPARWYITPDALPLLYQMTLGNYPIFLPVGGGVVSGAAAANGSPATDGPEGMLLGRPVFKSQHASAFSAQGDLLLVAPQWYRTITKAAGIETATSMHLYFDADALAYRVTFRIDGEPKIINPVTQAKGSNTLSPFVQLGAR